MSKYNKEYQRAYYLKHREEIRKRQNEHHQEIKDDPEFKKKNYENWRAWCKANPERRRLQQIRYRARKRYQREQEELAKQLRGEK